jgi:hypothetical protein
MLRTGDLHPPMVSHQGRDPALQRTDLSLRWRAATEVAWPLLRPDSHRLVDMSFQDTLGAGYRLPSPSLPIGNLPASHPTHNAVTSQPKPARLSSPILSILFILSSSSPRLPSPSIDNGITSGHPADLVAGVTVAFTFRRLVHSHVCLARIVLLPPTDLRPAMMSVSTPVDTDFAYLEEPCGSDD